VRTPKYQVLWTDTAKRDLEEIIGFIASEDAEAAHAIAGRLERRCARLAQLPERGRIVPELRAVDVYVYRELIERPWRIVYRYEKGRVYVMAVLDARRNLVSLLLERLARE
jgi:toxin ParE1/3/4